MNKFKLIFLLFFLINCSLDTKTGIWTEKKKLQEENKNIVKLFQEDKVLEKEINSNLKLKIKSKLFDNSSFNNDNNNGRMKYNGDLQSISKFKFKKIKNFNYFEPELIFDKKNLIFFNNKGSIIKFDTESKIIWKKNYYTKQEKKLQPVLNFAINSNTLIVIDNISKYYAVDINTGELVWSKNNPAPFNSQIKIYKDKFFAIDFDNVLRCYSIKDGSELWKVKAGDIFLKSEKRLSLIIVDNSVYFNNSTGEIFAVDINNGNLLWQTPTQSSSIYESAFFLKTSDIIANNKIISFSNNKNEFYVLDLKTGIIKWKNKINSHSRSTIINDIIISVSNEGYLFIIESETGKIIRTTDIFNMFKEKKRAKISPTGFIVGIENIYLTTDHGRLLIIDISTGKTKKIIKIDNDKISRPFVLNQNLFIIKENSIIKLN